MTDEEGIELIKLVSSFISRKAYNYVVLYESEEDMRSELLVDVVKAMKEYDSSKGELSTFVFSVCKFNVLKKISRLSKKKRRHRGIVSLQKPVHDSLDYTLEDTLESPIDVEHYCNVSVDVERYLPSLSPFTELRYIYKLSCEEISKLTSYSPHMVAVIISRDIDALRKKIESGRDLKRTHIQKNRIRQEAKVIPLLNELRMANGVEELREEPAPEKGKKLTKIILESLKEGGTDGRKE